VSLLTDNTLEKIKQAEQSAKKKLEEAEKKKLKLIEEAKEKAISMALDADKQDNDYREKELAKTKETITKAKEKMLKENTALIESMKKNSAKKLDPEADFVVKKFSREIL